MLSPLDDRYFEKVRDLHDFFSEDAMLKQKARIEIDYFLAICEELKLPLTEEDRYWIADVWNGIQPIHIKVIEEKTRHDIKAIEYYLRESFSHFGIPHDQMIHFGLTSQDVNSVALSFMLHKFNQGPMLNFMDELCDAIHTFGEKNSCIFPARTHGQLAVPTLFDKEMQVYFSRLQEVRSDIFDHRFKAKFGGAVGNLSAHYIAYPETHWVDFAEKFLQSYDLEAERCTTQVANNKSISAYFDKIRMINNILIDLCRDIWMYNSYGYFKQAVTPEEVGSSTMPQKINPILFENAEGNLELSNCLLEFMSNKLQISRMQRDLTDSTVTRNIGVALGHAAVAYKSIMEGLRKLSINLPAVERDLASTGLLAEAYQILLKKENVKDGYELVKDMERQGKTISDLPVSENVKNKLKAVTISSYVTHIRDTT